MIHFRILTFAGIAALFVWGCQADSIMAPDQDQPMPDPNPAEEAAADTLATGQFVDKDGETTSGTYYVTSTNGDLELILAEDFATSDGPDLHVVLSPVSASSTTSENALANGEALVVDELQAFAGRQRYDLPDDTDLAEFKSVLIYCIQYSHLFGAAPL